MRNYCWSTIIMNWKFGEFKIAWSGCYTSDGELEKMVNNRREEILLLWIWKDSDNDMAYKIFTFWWNIVDLESENENVKGFEVLRPYNISYNIIQMNY